MDAYIKSFGQVTLYEPVANGRKLRPVRCTILEEPDQVAIRSGFCRYLIEEFKAYGGRWRPSDKAWTFKDTRGLWFQLNFLMNRNPYGAYTKHYNPIDSRFKLFSHQETMVAQALTNKRVIWAAEMGLGKTLAAIATIELSGKKNWWWVGPKSALQSVYLEFKKWGCTVRPHFLTYDAFTARMMPTVMPEGIVYDEAHALKNPRAQRTMRAMAFAERMVMERPDGFIIAMTGSPAPKSPFDWWSLGESVCPGYFRERTYYKFQQRLALFAEATSAITGQSFPKLLGFRTGTACDICCKPPTDDVHVDDLHTDYHAYEASPNEVGLLYRRMAGLTTVFFKHECTDLPDKVYKVINIPMPPILARHESLILSQSETVLETMLKLRELSDGFQYKDVETGGQSQCPVCQGTGLIASFLPLDDPEAEPETIQVDCPKCEGRKTIPTTKREAVQLTASPKAKALEELLDEMSDHGRLVIYAAFIGSIDRCRQTAEAAGWDWIQVTGSGWKTSLNLSTPGEMLEYFQKGMTRYTDEKPCVFIGHPQAAGQGLTLTAAHTIVFYSNSFAAQDRIQAEDRIHRFGMDKNKGATIIDFVVSKMDTVVIENLRAKRELQALTLNDLRKQMAAAPDAEAATIEEESTDANA